MSALMITGDQRMVEEYESTYSSLIYNNGIYAKGLGLLDSVIVDQHFVTRSRYNRIISAMADTNLPYGIGIEESTALIVAPDYMTVAGENQVILFRRPGSYFRHNDRIGLRNLRINIYLPGDTFHLK
jgi:cyanophycinase